MHETAERLYLAAKELQSVHGQSAVAKLLNQSPQTMKNWESRGISKQGALVAEQVLGVRPAWLLRGEEPMRSGAALSATAKTSTSSTASLTTVPRSGGVALSVSQTAPNVAPLSREEAMRRMPPAEGYVRLPILAEAAAGAGRDPSAFELVDHVDVAEEWVRRTLRANPSNVRVLTARGHSMTGQIEDGDVMFVVPTTDFVDDGTYIISIGGLLRVKRLRLRIDKTLSIESNDGSEPETIPQAQIEDTLHICGRVIGAWSLRKL